MRNLLLSLAAALALLITAAAASASSIDVIWQNSGLWLTGGVSSGVVTGDVVVTIGPGDTAIGGTGAALELSADADLGFEPGGTTIVAFSMTTLPGWYPLPLGSLGEHHSENVIAQGDLFGSGVVLAPGSSTTIGTITIHMSFDFGFAGTVTVSPTGPGDDIIGNTGTGSLLSEFSFNAGWWYIPEPTTVSLLGLGLVGLAAGRRRR